MSIESSQGKNKEVDRWAGYNVEHSEKPPRALFLEALNHVADHERALDVGAGTMRATRKLVEIFDHVDAVDMSAQAEMFAQALHASNLHFARMPIEQYAFQEHAYDLVNAERVLPFVGREYFPSVMHDTLGSVKPGGIFTGHLFGVRDQWNTQRVQHQKGRETVFLEADEVRALFNEFELITFNDREYDIDLPEGKTKHWHLFEIIARKK